MKKKCAFFIGVVLVFAMACGKSSGRYAEYRTYMEKSIQAQEEYLSAIDRAESAGDVALAINKFAERIQALEPLRKSHLEKYPEMSMEKEPPAELRDIANRQNELAEKIERASEKNLAPYLLDPVVVEAVKNLSRAMGEN